MSKRSPPSVKITLHPLSWRGGDGEEGLGQISLEKLYHALCEPGPLCVPEHGALEVAHSSWNVAPTPLEPSGTAPALATRGLRWTSHPPPSFLSAPHPGLQPPTHQKQPSPQPLPSYAVLPTSETCNAWNPGKDQQAGEKAGNETCSKEEKQKKKGN